MKLARWCEKTWETWTQRIALTEPHEDFTPNPNDNMLGIIPWLTPDPPACFIFFLSFPSFPSLHHFTTLEGNEPDSVVAAPHISRVTQSHMTLASIISQDRAVFIALQEPADTSITSHPLHSPLLSVTTALPYQIAPFRYSTPSFPLTFGYTHSLRRDVVN